VLSIHAKNNTVVVEHVGIIKRHTRPTLRRTSRRDRGKRSWDQRFECDGGLRELRQSIPGLATRFAGRIESSQLPPLQHGAGQVKDKVEEGDEESIAGKIPGGNGASVMSALAGRT